MNHIRIIALCCAVAWMASLARGQDDPVYRVMIPELRLADVSPICALARFHDAWQTAAGTNHVPVFFVVGSTNGYGYSGSGWYQRIDARLSCDASNLLAVLEEIAHLHHRSYSNAIVFVETPFPEGQVFTDRIPTTANAAKLLGLYDGPSTNAQRQTENCLRAHGITTWVGCGAVYLPKEGMLRIWNLGFEVKWARFLIERLNQGVMINDVSIDAPVHFATEFSVYENGCWRKCPKPQMFENDGPGPAPSK